jgi:hypothetical protein
MDGIPKAICLVEKILSHTIFVSPSGGLTSPGIYPHFPDITYKLYVE